MATAEDDRLVRRNPCQIRGASTERPPERPLLTLAQVYALADGVPDRFRMLVLLGTFGSLRWGELAALTRGAVDAEAVLPDLREHLRRYVADDAAALVFTGPTGVHIRRSGF